LDLFERGFTLLSPATDRAWGQAARKAAEEFGIPLSAHTVGCNGDFRTEDIDWEELYGLETDGAVLVRPDGHVAGRSQRGTSDPDTIMRAAFHTVAQG